MLIHGGSPGTTCIILLETKFDITLRIISVKDYTCQFVSGFELKCCSQGKLEVQLFGGDNKGPRTYVFHFQVED